MELNPYEPPRDANAPAAQIAKRPRWGRRCVAALAVSVIGFAMNLLVYKLQPYGVLGDGPSTPERRMTAWVMVVLPSIAYGSLIFAFVAGWKWLLGTLKKGPDQPAEKLRKN